MQSITTLNLNLQYPNYATTMHAVQNDKLTRKVTAMLFDGSVPFTPDEGALALVRFHKPDQTYGFYDVDEDGNTAVTWSGNVATICLAEQALTCAGTVLCQIQFYTQDGQRLTTFTWKIEVQECAISDEQFLSTDYYSVLTAQISAAMSITYRPPYINTTTGNWMVWSVATNQYVDSGYSARGSQGEPGAAGASVESVTRISGTGAAGTIDTYRINLTNGTYGGTFDVYNGKDGTNVAGVEKVSGTGAGGTIDTYRVILSDGTTAGTFNVYNGADGTGSPGSLIPVMDGTGAVGTAIAYAREDHQHPSDSSKADLASPAFTGTPTAPTAASGTNTTQIATTEFVQGEVEGKADEADVVVDMVYNPTFHILYQQKNGQFTSVVSADDTPTSGSNNLITSDAVYDATHDTQKSNIYMNSVEVLSSAWATHSDSLFSAYTYRAAIPNTNVDSTMYALVTFSPTEALSGNYAPACQTYDGGIYIYSKVNTAITIPNIAILR